MKKVTLKELRVIVRRLVESELDEAGSEQFYYVVMDRDIHVVGPRPYGFNALKPGETFIAGPFEEEANAELEASKKQALARTGTRRSAYRDDLDESDEEHEDDPRWDDHADPTGKEWHAGLDEASYDQDLDGVMGGLQTSLKSLEDAHPQAPDEESKATIAGLHSDLFNAQASARPYVRRLKSKAR